MPVINLRIDFCAGDTPFVLALTDPELIAGDNTIAVRPDSTFSGVCSRRNRNRITVVL